MGQKTSPKTISEIGRRLGVSSVMEGCLHSSRNHIQVATQLIRISDLTHVWTASFDGKISDLLQLQMAIARQIAESLHRASV
jgi:adenylate cyclase